MTLTEFLMARIAEDESTARHTLDDYAAHRPSWEMAGSGVVFLGDDDSLDDLLTIGDAPVAQHIARHDPARVLAECEAKRRIVELALYWEEGPNEYGQMREALQILAGVYADHPDYRDEWKP